MTDFFTGEVTWWHYAICILALLGLGLSCGYFIWRKESMQATDAELEVRRTEDELRHLRDDLSREETLIRPDEEGAEIAAMVEDSSESKES